MNINSNPTAYAERLARVADAATRPVNDDRHRPAYGYPACGAAGFTFADRPSAVTCPRCRALDGASDAREAE